jgi:hypothetical protein
MNTEENIYFERGRYYFGYDHFSDIQISKENIIPIDNFVYAALSDANELGIVFVERDGKKGVLTMDACGQGGYGAQLYSIAIFPFLYDEMLLNGGFNGDGFGYIAVRINHNWGVLRVEDHTVNPTAKARRQCLMLVPCVYPTKEAAIALIRSKRFHPEFGWHNPFKAENHQFVNTEN